MILQCGSHTFRLAQKTLILGVLNVTPDSFYDGNLFLDPARAVDRANQMVADGADIIDIGGESTRPASEPVSLADELRRVIPVISALAKNLPVPISIDTYKSAVASRAIDAGASMVNDISGLRFDPEMARVVASTGVPVCVMHIRGTPKSMQMNPSYEALIPEIMDSLRQSISIALDAGITEENIIVDPGIGFGKTANHNLEILNRLKEFTALGKPLLLGVSRKAFIGRILDDAPVQDRLAGTLAAVAVAVCNGAQIVRVHDVKEAAQAVRVVDAILREMCC